MKTPLLLIILCLALLGRAAVLAQTTDSYGGGATSDSYYNNNGYGSTNSYWNGMNDYNTNGYGPATMDYSYMYTPLAASNDVGDNAGQSEDAKKLLANSANVTRLNAKCDVLLADNLDNHSRDALTQPVVPLTIDMKLIVSVELESSINYTVTFLFEADNG